MVITNDDLSVWPPFCNHAILIKVISFVAHV